MSDPKYTFREDTTAIERLQQLISEMEDSFVREFDAYMLRKLNEPTPPPPTEFKGLSGIIREGRVKV